MAAEPDKEYAMLSIHEQLLKWKNILASLRVQVYDPANNQVFEHFGSCLRAQVNICLSVQVAEQVRGQVYRLVQEQTRGSQ